MKRPFEGIKVLDFTHGVAGPYATMLLGDLGCDVIKVERPGRGDSTRFMNVSRKFDADIPRVGGDYFLAINRNKRDITIEFKTQEGRDLCLALAGWADVVVQSFRPGLMASMGLGYEDFRKLNPEIIYANLTAYGKEGPLADRAGMDVAVQARAGIMSITGAMGSNDPIRPGVSIADFGGGIYLMTSIVTALYHRERTGEGQEIDASLMDATVSMLSNYSVAVLDGGAELKPMGSGHPQIAPYQAFQTSDGAVVVGAGTNRAYTNLCKTLGCEALGADTRFATNNLRVEHRETLIPLLAPYFLKRTTAEWEAALTPAGVPCAPVNTLKQAFSHEHMAASGMIQAMKHPELGEIHLTGVPFHFSRSGGDLRRLPPQLGEHTMEILKDVLGMDQAGIDKLTAAKAI